MYEPVKIAEKIKQLVKEQGVKIKDMLDSCGLSKNLISSMLSGGSIPKSDNLAVIADYLDCSVDYLLGRTDDRYSHKIGTKGSVNIAIKHSFYKVFAGAGFDLDDHDQWERISIPDTPEARQADFALTIKGDSMEPIYYDGDMVLVAQQAQVEVGEIGIFAIEGKGYIKKFGGDRLISLNEKYNDIMLADYDADSIRCFGRVIGRL